jgi:peptidoglycan hydrolase-like protein with peptidoglycan-binding domain
MRLARAILIAAIAGSLFVCGIIALPHAAYAQADGVTRVAAAKKAAPKSKTAAPKKKAAAPAPAVNGVYTGMPLSERLTIQFDLAWTGYYNGLIDGEFTDRSIAAVKAFQKDRKFKETGVLAAPERALLAALSNGKQEQVGWRMVDDKPSGAHVGLPLKQAPNSSAGSRGTRWYSAQGQVQVETFRVREPGLTLASAFEQQKTLRNRKLTLSVIRKDDFILSGTQGLKKFYVRAYIRDLEIRGITILWDPATEVIMDPVVVVMASAFAPFPGTGLMAQIGPPQRRVVDYGTGIVVTRRGHVLTDSQLVEGCGVIEIAGHGDADRVAEDPASSLSLLRIFDSGDLVPAPMVHEGARGGALTLVGISDPQAQAGGRAASTAAAQLADDVLQPAPQLGFSGAAALDRQGRFAGIVALKTPVMASAEAANVPLPQASLTPVATIRRFLDSHYVMPSTGRPGVEAIKLSLVRVICVRR